MVQYNGTIMVWENRREGMVNEWIVFFIYIFYMIINLITDSKKLETYNRLHLIAFFLILGFLFLNGYSILTCFVVILSSLIIGLLFENISIMKIGSGDTKMIIVSSLFILILTPIKPWIIPILLIFFYKFIVTIIVGTFVTVKLIYSKFRKNNIVQGTFELGKYRITITPNGRFPSIAYQIPATGGIAGATILLTMIF